MGLSPSAGPRAGSPRAGGPSNSGPLAENRSRSWENTLRRVGASLWGARGLMTQSEPALWFRTSRSNTSTRVTQSPPAVGSPHARPFQGHFLSPTVSGYQAGALKTGMSPHEDVTEWIGASDPEISWYVQMEVWCLLWALWRHCLKLRLDGLLLLFTVFTLWTAPASLYPVHCWWSLGFFPLCNRIRIMLLSSSSLCTHH